MQGSRSGLIIGFFLSGLSLATPLPKSFKGFSQPTSIKRPRPELQNSQPGKESFQECFVFRKRAIVQVDTGSKGAELISIRPLKTQSDIKLACSSKTWPNEIVLPPHEQYFLGVISSFLFTQSADVFGHLGSVWAYDLKTGKEIYEANYDYEKDFVVSPHPNGVSIEYYQLMKNGHLPPELKTGPPDCPSEISSDEKPHYQIFAKVKVRRLGISKPRFLNARPTCYPTP